MIKCLNKFGGLKDETTGLLIKLNSVFSQLTILCTVWQKNTGQNTAMTVWRLRTFWYVEESSRISELSPSHGLAVDIARLRAGESGHRTSLLWCCCFIKILLWNYIWFPACNRLAAC